MYKTAAEYLLFHSDLNPQPLPGCSFDSDGDSVDDGVDQCPGTTSTEIALAGSYPSKLTIDMKGCPILSAKMWESTVVDVTTSNSNSANPLIELLFSVDAGLPQVLTARQYETSQMVQVQIMDPTCQNKFDDVTATGDEVLPLTVNMNEKGSFTGQIPFDSIPISVDVQLNPDNYVGSPVWATSALYDVGTVDFCLNFAILSDTLGEFCPIRTYAPTARFVGAFFFVITFTNSLLILPTSKTSTIFSSPTYQNLSRSPNSRRPSCST